MLMFMVHKNLTQNVSLHPLSSPQKNPFRHCAFVICGPNGDNPGIIPSHSPRKINFYLMKNYFMYLKYCNFFFFCGVVFVVPCYITELGQQSLP